MSVIFCEIIAALSSKIIRKIIQHKIKIVVKDKDLIKQEISHSDRRIYVNNIAGTDRKMRKLEVIINHIKLNKEMNTTTKTTTFKKFVRRQTI